MFLTFWKKKTIIELLNQHLVLMTRYEKIEHLKAIIPQVRPGVNVSRNPGRHKSDEVKERMVSI